MSDTPSTASPINRQSHHPAVHEQLYGSIDPVEVLRRCGRTFYAASLVLPPRVRTDLALLYALCRAIDDCADSADTSGTDEADRLLDVISSGLCGEHDRSPVVTAFRALAMRSGVPIVLPLQLIEGVRSDLGGVRVETLDELLRYSYRVASTVGLMMCRILGVPPAGDAFAVDLGIAMQLTNIARDVDEDAGTGRVYLPAEWVSPDAVFSRASADADGSGEVDAAVIRLLDLAERYYESAELGMQFLPLAVRGGIRAAAWNYRAIGAVVRKESGRAAANGDAGARRVRTSGISKLLRTSAAVWASSLESIPLGPADSHDDSLHLAVRSLRLGAV